jgi:hypothetical protein
MCVTGKADTLQLLFANKANRQLPADVYDNAPMCQAATSPSPPTSSASSSSP